MNEIEPILFYLDSLTKSGKLTIERLYGGESYNLSIDGICYVIMGPLTEEKLMEANIYIRAAKLAKDAKWPS